MNRHRIFAALADLALAVLTAAIVGAAVFAAALYLSGRAHADLPGYGFTAPAGTYDQEYQDCAWPDDGSGRRYVPGYPSDRERSRCARPE